MQDPRIFGKVLLTPWQTGFVASAHFTAEVPLGQLHPDAATFTGDTWPTLTPAVTVGYTHEWIKAAFDVGYLLRAPSMIGDLRVGHEITWGAAA
ncbi:MAG: hypothetical protein GY822_04305 [Deltaproteobacteria bacterium]|nr:hypothetical protein [Deltaproteobacteria bacterium]